MTYSSSKSAESLNVGIVFQYIVLILTGLDSIFSQSDITGGNTWAMRTSANSPQLSVIACSHIS